MAGQPPKFKSVEELEFYIEAYFNECKNESRPLTLSGLALALDCSRMTIYNYSKKDKFFDTIKKARLMCENFAEEYLFTGKNIAGAIFNLKNNYDWKDKSETDITSKGDKITPIFNGKSVSQHKSNREDIQSEQEN